MAKKSSKGRHKDNRKTKVRPQDPSRNAVTSVRARHNVPPILDPDEEDIPPMAIPSFVPLDPLPEGAADKKTTLAADAKGNRALGLSRREAKIIEKRMKVKDAKERGVTLPPKAKKPKKELTKKELLGEEAGDDDEDDEDGGDEGAEAAAPAGKLELPKQRPGESPKEYSRRIDQALHEHNMKNNKKVTGARKREKRRERRKEERMKKAKKKGASDGRQGNRAGKGGQFGEVVERPPILSSAALKSRSKLKASKAKAAAEKKAKNASNSAELSKYASQVKQAYDAFKKKRAASSKTG
mmetsp:Transcript_33/g.90  ORF Transcript_33/g.90 Transcript_33/m.90 type:complete len:297 (-) Transcript_33:53-943(-)